MGARPQTPARGQARVPRTLTGRIRELQGSVRGAEGQAGRPQRALELLRGERQGVTQEGMPGQSRGERMGLHSS